MKPTDPTPEEYVKWLKKQTMDFAVDIYNQIEFTNKLVIDFDKLILTELRDNSTTEINRMFFNECLTKLKELC